MSVDSLGITLDVHDSVRLWASRSAESACLVIEADGTHCEIGLDRVHVEELRDQLPDTLAGLDRWAAEQVGCEQAGAAEKWAVDAAARALDLAVAAAAVGAHDMAASLRAAAAEATAKAETVDGAVRAFESATSDADYAAATLICATGEAETALHRLRASERPAELADETGAVTP